MMEKIKRYGKIGGLWLSGPGAVFFILPPLMLLLVSGTLAQRWIGLYDAQNMFFSTFIVWWGPLPLPGGYTLCGLLAAGLLIKFLWRSPWGWAKAGINIAHLGVLILLFGGFITAFKAEEGYIVIPEGGAARFVSDYYQRQLFIVRNGALIHTIPHQALREGAVHSFSGVPFTLEVRARCRNCAIVERDTPDDETAAPLQGMAQFMALEDSPPEEQEEANLYGLTALLSGAGEHDGLYILLEALPEPLRLELDQGVYELFYGKQQRELPFALRLERFETTYHPGTTMASAYESALVLEDGALSWPVRISMNNPLRYKGYSIYQSSFIDPLPEQEAQGSATVLAVVRNAGWLFPYIGTAVIALGLLLHLLIMAARGGRRVET